MSENGKNIVYSTEVLEFVAVANEFCKFTENSDKLSKKGIIHGLHKYLALLYTKASFLPEFTSVLEESNEKYVTEDMWQGIEQIFLKKLGKHDAYLEIYHPDYQTMEENVRASIAENVADIYQDIKDFVTLFRVGVDEIMNEALWECQQNFKQYWGQKLLNTLRIIHMILYSNEELSDEDDQQDGMDFDKIDTSDWIITKMQKNARNDEE